MRLRYRLNLRSSKKLNLLIFKKLIIMYFTKSKIRKIWVGGEQKNLCYAVLSRGADVNLEQLSSEISAATTLNPADVLACLRSLQDFLFYHLQTGSAIKLGTLGSFIPKIKAQAVESQDAITADTIRLVSCRFYPSVALKKNLKGVTMEERTLPTTV